MTQVNDQVIKVIASSNSIVYDHLEVISSQADITECGLLVSTVIRSIFALGKLVSKVSRAFSADNVFLHSRHR